MGCLCQSGFWCVSRVLGCPVCPAELTHNDTHLFHELLEMLLRIGQGAQSGQLEIRKGIWGIWIEY